MSSEELFKCSYETDPAVLSRREKQLQYGKSTGAYQRYISVLPKAERSKFHPRTPDKMLKYSRRRWDGSVWEWKRRLHEWDHTTMVDILGKLDVSERPSVTRQTLKRIYSPEVVSFFAPHEITIEDLEQVEAKDMIRTELKLQEHLKLDRETLNQVKEQLKQQSDPKGLSEDEGISSPNDSLELSTEIIFIDE